MRNQPRSVGIRIASVSSGPASLPVEMVLGKGMVKKCLTSHSSQPVTFAVESVEACVHALP